MGYGYSMHANNWERLSYNVFRSCFKLAKKHLIRKLQLMILPYHQLYTDGPHKYITGLKSTLNKDVFMTLKWFYSLPHYNHKLQCISSGFNVKNQEKQCRIVKEFGI